MKMLKTTVPMPLAATVLSGCSTFQEGNVPVCAATVRDRRLGGD